MELGILSFRHETICAGFKRLVAEAGHKATEVLVQDAATPELARASAERAWSEAGEVIERAGALFLPSWKGITDQSFVASLHRRIGGGVRVLIADDRARLDAQNDFLAFYGIRFTEFVVRQDGPAVQIPCGEDRLGIFAGIEAAHVNRPSLIIVEPPAIPLLTADSMLVIDRRRDIPAIAPHGSSAVMAVCEGQNGGALLAVGGSILNDAYVGATGARFPGIDDNRRLARNIIDFLLPS